MLLLASKPARTLFRDDLLLVLSRSLDGGQHKRVFLIEKAAPALLLPASCGNRLALPLVVRLALHRVSLRINLTTLLTGALCECLLMLLWLLLDYFSHDRSQLCLLLEQAITAFAWHLKQILLLDTAL